MRPGEGGARDQQYVAAEDDHEGGPREPAGDEQEQHGRIDHEPVGERVRVPAELGLDSPPPCQDPVDLVGHARDPEHDAGRPGVAAARLRQQDDEQRHEREAEHRERVRDVHVAGPPGHRAHALTDSTKP